MWAQVAKEQGALLGMSAEEFTRHRTASVPLGRMEKPEDVAHVIAFLAGPRSGYMTGQALSVDCGLNVERLRLARSLRAPPRIWTLLSDRRLLVPVGAW